MATIYAINANTLAPSEYRDLSVIGLAVLDNQLYGIKTDGFVELTGSDDEGADIDAYIETGEMPLGSGNLKRFPRLYIGGTAAKGVTVTVTTEESGVARSRDYPKAPWLGALRTRVAKLAGGPKSRYVQVKIANRDGGSLKIEQADLRVDGLPHRV